MRSQLNATETILVSQFTAAAVSTFMVMTKIPCKPDKIRIVNDRDSDPDTNVSIMGVMELSSGNINGEIALYFSKKSFLEIYQRVWGESAPEITNQIQDAAGELLNIIYGNAKAQLNKSLDFNLHMARPKVFIGSDIKKYREKNKNVIIQPFDWQTENFGLEFSVKC